VFHLDPNGRAVLGEPQAAPSKDRLKESEHRSIFEGLHIPTVDELTEFGEGLKTFNFLRPKPLLAIGGSVLVLWLMYSFIFGAGESVESRSRRVAWMLVGNNESSFVSLAPSEEMDRADAKKLFEGIRTKLDEARKVWGSSEPLVQVVVVQEDFSAGKGETEVFVMSSATVSTSAAPPPPPPPPPVAVKPANTNAGAPKMPPGSPVTFHLSWIWGSGRWLLDSRQSLALFTR
jgi:hypothetical protein